MKGIVLHLLCAAAISWLGVGSALAETAKELNERGSSLFERREYSEALKLYSRALQKDPDYSEALYNRGLTFFRLRQYRQAGKDFQELTRLDPADHNAFNLQGLAAMKLGDHDLALSRFIQAAQINESSQYLYNAALAAFKRGNLSLARKFSGEAVTLDPMNGKARELFSLCIQDRINEYRKLQAEKPVERRNDTKAIEAYYRWKKTRASWRGGSTLPGRGGPSSLGSRASAGSGGKAPRRRG